MTKNSHWLCWSLDIVLKLIKDEIKEKALWMCDLKVSNNPVCPI